MNAYTIVLSFECPFCRSNIPVNGFTEEVLCHNCFKGTSLGEAWWKQMLNEDLRKEAVKVQPGHARTTNYLSGMEERVAYGNRNPRCQACKHEFDGKLISAAAKEGMLICPGCKEERIRVRPAPALALAVIPDAEFVLYEGDLGKDLGTDGQKAAQPVMFACLSCSAGLPVDGSSRTVTCTHCATANYLPDALWLRLHPAPMSQVFFVTRRGYVPIEPEDLPTQLSGADVSRLLKEPGIQDDTIRQIHSQHRAEKDILLPLAGSTRTPFDVIESMYKDLPQLDPIIRRTLCARRDLNKTQFEALAADTDLSVRQALLKRTEYTSANSNLLNAAIQGLAPADIDDHTFQNLVPEKKLLEYAQTADKKTAVRMMTCRHLSLDVIKVLGRNPEYKEIYKKHRLVQELSFFKRLFFWK